MINQQVKENILKVKNEGLRPFVPVAMPDNQKGFGYVFITSDFSGSGFAKQAADAGFEVIVATAPKEPIEDDKQEAYDLQGKGSYKTKSLSSMMRNREQYKDWHWIWDGNHAWEEGEKLREEGFKVFGGSKLQYDCENDREFGIQLAESVGLMSPSYQEFGSYADGIKFLEENPDKAFVFKPNNESDSALTFVPDADDAINDNIELRKFMEAVKINDFILQEKVKGVEVNFELLVVGGVPIMAQANLECKKRSNGDWGMATGCMQDVCWMVPLDCPLIERTVGKFKQYLAEINYTGFWDCNVILSDKQDYFLEFCNRIGYNAHISFARLMDRPLYEIISEMLTGSLEPVKMHGFAASITLRTDRPKTGLPIYYPDSIKDDVYLFDFYMEKDQVLMGGFGHEVAVVTGKGYTICEAFKNAKDNALKVKFPNMDMRTDGGEKDYPSAPHKRYEALQAFKSL